MRSQEQAHRWRQAAVEWDRGYAGPHAETWDIAKIVVRDTKNEKTFMFVMFVWYFEIYRQDDSFIKTDSSCNSTKLPI